MQPSSVGNRVQNAFVVVAGLGLLLIGAPVACGEESVKLLPAWKKGDKLVFEVVKTRERTQGGKVTLKSTCRADLEIEVEKAEKDGYDLALTWGEWKFDDPKQAESPLVVKLVNLVKGRRIVLAVDSEGSIEGVRNWEELKQSTTKIAATLIDEIKAAGVDQATAAKIRAELAAAYSSKEQIEQSCTREIQLVFLPLGFKFEGDKPVEFEDELPNPLGGEAFPSQARLTLKEVDKKAGVAKVSWSQTVAPKDATRIMEETLKGLAKRLGKPVPDAEVFKTYTIEDSAEFTVELSTGWATRFSHKRVAKTDGGSQEDGIAFTRKKD